MHHALTIDTWTALKDYLVFRFKLHGAGEGTVHARVSCKTDPQARTHEFELPPGRRREFHFQFRGTDEGDLYVRGVLQRAVERRLDGSWHGGVFGDVHYGHTGWHDDQHFEGYMVMADGGSHQPEAEPQPEPEPQPDPAPPDPGHEHEHEHKYGDAGDDDAWPETGAAADGDLFPYVYLRTSPTPDAAARRRCFIDFPATQASPPLNTLYNVLCAALPLGRAQLHALALRYLQAQANLAPGHANPLHRLPARLLRFIEVDVAARELYRQPEVLAARILELLGVDSAAAVGALLGSPACLAAIDAAWQSYIALVVAPEWDLAMLRELGHFLGAAHLLDHMYGARATPDAAPSPVALYELAHASIVLPHPLFPLPPPAAPPASPPASPPPSAPPADADGAIVGCAIGELQMVKQRLLRYEAGHIAYIDNVVRGEKKETRRRRILRQVDYAQQRSEDASALENQASDERNNLLEEARKSVAEKTVGHAYDDFQTRYGPPTQATLTGSWTESIAQGAHPGNDDIIRFAREVLSRTVHRITRQVDQLRGSSTMSENEDTVVSTIDNTGQPHHLVGVYRWLNQVVEACVVNYGNRLMVEFTLLRPAQRLNAQAHRPDRADDSSLRLPTAPSLFSFNAVHFDSYAELAAAYQVTDVEAPPALRKSISATLRAGEAKLLAVPPGYMVATAEVNAIDAPAGAAALQVLVGRHLLTPGADSGLRRTFGEDNTIAVAMGAQPAQIMSSPPSTPAEPLVNVNIVCVPTPTAITAWRIKTYQAIVAGYQRQCARQDADEARGRALAPAQLRQIERRELTRGCMRLLRRRNVARPGAAAQPDEQARLLQFLEACFEWNEMSYRCHVGGEEGSPLGAAIAGRIDSQFDSFLHANLARVLLPVQPRHAAALLYYLAEGSPWSGDARMVPVHGADVALVQQMKLDGDSGRVRGRRVGRAWEVRVPTAMQVLDGCPLPACHDAGGRPAASEGA